MAANTTTSTPPTPTRQTGRLELLATALEPVVHGAGTVGNVSKQRLQTIINPQTGEESSIPFISGNSIKHMIREHGARFALRAMQVPDGALSKAVIDLLFSGGSLTKSGASVNLRESRQLCELFPIVGICGYGAGNAMMASKIAVDHWHLVCEENAWRMPEPLRALPTASKRSGLFRDEEFKVRHDALRDPHIARMLLPEKLEEIDARKAVKLKKGQAGEAPEKDRDSAQMIAEFQVVRPGAQFWGCVTFRDLSPLELAALTSALSDACEGTMDADFVYRVGAQTRGGMGRVKVSFKGSLRADVRAPEWTESDSALPARPGGEGKDALSGYVEHLQQHRAEILAALERIMS